MNKAVLIAAGAAAGFALVALVKNPGGVGQGIGAGAVDLVDGVVSGGVFAIGDKMGLPDPRQLTTVEKGRAQLAAGDYWNASFNLPAGEFIKGSWNRLFN